MFRKLERNLAETREYAVLHGEVHTARPSDAPIVVLVYAGAGGGEQLVDHFVLAGPGPYYFLVPAGTYRLAAFEDRNGNSAYDPDADTAALLRSGEPVVAPGGATLHGLDIEIGEPGSERIPLSFAATETETTVVKALPDYHVGEVAGLDDPRFSDANAELGLWQPIDFLFQVGAGVYFLEPYDPQKIPVLFVHGAVGHPGIWADMIARLDRQHFQPWLVYYPTAPRLANVATAIDRWIQYLYVKYRFRRMAVVAHSMGGLVGRAFINRTIAAGDAPAERIRLFITLSTPWGGHSAAQRGVEKAPVVVPSWYDMAPDSAFLRTLLEPPLPPTLEHDLLFSYAGGSVLMGSANDGAVTLASQLTPRAQAEASKVRGFDESHRTILHSPEVAAWVNAQLATLATE